MEEHKNYPHNQIENCPCYPNCDDMMHKQGGEQPQKPFWPPLPSQPIPPVWPSMGSDSERQDPGRPDPGWGRTQPWQPGDDYQGGLNEDRHPWQSDNEWNERSYSRPQPWSSGNMEMESAGQPGNSDADMGMPGSQMRPDMGMPGNQMRPDMGMPENQMRPGYMYYPNGSSDRMRGVINPVFRNEEMEKEEQETEHDLERLKGMYPDIAKKIQLFVEEACDDLEYAGSPMFDEQPDKVNMMRTVNSIYDKVREDVPVEEEEDKDDLFAMNKESRRRYPPGKNWLRDFVEVMLYHEMFQRRCRHRHCRRWY